MQEEQNVADTTSEFDDADISDDAVDENEYDPASDFGGVM